MAAGHQLPGSLVVPLASFPVGDYRLEIKVTERPALSKYFFKGIRKSDDEELRGKTGLVVGRVVTENVKSDGTRIRTPWSKTVIYEAHVRGLTQFNLDIPESERGTYKALAHPSVIKYLKELGVTALELQPIHHFLTEPAIAARGRQNYWGYNPIAFSAPHRDYAATENPITELRDAVSTLHQNGIEVILDVVYNHTAEGGVRSEEHTSELQSH